MPQTLYQSSHRLTEPKPSYFQVSIGDTDRIHAALDNTENSGICQDCDFAKFILGPSSGVGFPKHYRSLYNLFYFGNRHLGHLPHAIQPENAKP